MDYFVNAALNKGIEDYLASKDNESSILYNSFLVVVIRALITLYSELDIINPYKLDSASGLTNNLIRYGYKKEQVEEFYSDVQRFFILDSNNDKTANKIYNPYFVKVQKDLIDMYTCKRLCGKETKEKEFFDLLYTSKTTNVLRQSYNYLNALDTNEVLDYYNSKLNIEKEVIIEEEKDILPASIYEFFDFKQEDIYNMKKEEIDNINKQIYQNFNIKGIEVNRNYLLEEKIKSLKPQPLLTGNGYVDILLIMGVIVTIGMVAVIFGVFVF